MLLASPSTASHAQCVSLVFGSVDLSLCLWPQLYIVHSTTFFCASQKQISVFSQDPPPPPLPEWAVEKWQRVRKPIAHF